MALADKDRRAAFEATCLPLMRALHGFAMRLSRRPEDASDLVQETLLKAYRTFQNFEPGTNARAWLLKILHSVFLNRNRKERRSAEWLPLDEVVERLLGSASGAQQPSAVELESALQSLPEEYRSVILLVDVEGLSYEEAAAALACPVGTVRSRLHRARAMMLTRLQPAAASFPGRPGRGPS